METSAIRFDPPQCVASTRAEDQALVRGVLAGDAKARQAFVDRMACIPVLVASRLRRRGIVPHPAEVYDLSQEAFSAIWERLRDFRGEGSLEAWVHGFVLRITLAAARRHADSRPRPLQEEHFQLPAAEASQPLSDDAHRLLELIALAPASDRAALELRYAEGLEYCDIAKRLCCSERAARGRVERAKERLRTIAKSLPKS